MDIKKVLLAMLLLTFTSGVFAQLKLGIQGGVGFWTAAQSNTGGVLKSFPVDPTKESASVQLTYPQTGGFGYTGGLFFDYSIGDRIGIMVEPSITFRQYSEVTKTLDADTLISILSENYIFNQLTYLELPILFKFNLEPNTGKYGRKSFFSVFAGPQIGLYLNHSEFNETTNQVSLYDQRSVVTGGSNRGKDFKGDDFALTYSAIDFSAVAGVMYDFEKGLRFGLRYVGNFMPVNDNVNFDIYHHSVRATIGYNFIPQKRKRRY